MYMPVSVLLLSDLRKGKLLVLISEFYCLGVLMLVRLDRLQRLDRISRDGSPYMDLYYRGHWQPFCAYVGLLGCTLLVLFSGWVPIYILSAKGKLGGNDNLLGNNALIAQIVGAYSGVSFPHWLYNIGH